jgi:TetR/AcrR family transcriptional repressor of nem operon
MNDTKEHILTVSLNLFLQKSFKEVTMKEIEEKTGLSKGAFYHYFSSKEQLFEEVMAHFYSDIMITDYSKFSQTSLLQFYNDSIDAKKEKINTSKVVLANGKAEFTSNHYFLLFDAMKMLPNFNKQCAKQQKDELKAWATIIQVAKTSGEINSVLTNEQIAKLFVYSRRGIGIDCIMADNLDGARKEIKTLWDTLYKSLQS